MPSLIEILLIAIGSFTFTMLMFGILALIHVFNQINRDGLTEQGEEGVRRGDL